MSCAASIPRSTSHKNVPVYCTPNAASFWFTEKEGGWKERKFGILSSFFKKGEKNDDLWYRTCSIGKYREIAWLLGVGQFLSAFARLQS